MGYRLICHLIYHPAVLADDLPAINRNLPTRICRAMEQRLTAAPTHYGEPLRQQVRGYWKLRVGDYRIVYRLVGQEVWIYSIPLRRDVYAVSPKRLLWHP